MDGIFSGEFFQLDHYRDGTGGGNRLVSNLDTRVTLDQLLAAGFTPASTAVAVASGDMRLLRHSGVIHIQIHPPGDHNPDDGCAGVPARV